MCVVGGCGLELFLPVTDVPLSGTHLGCWGIWGRRPVPSLWASISLTEIPPSERLGRAVRSLSWGGAVPGPGIGPRDGRAAAA